MLSTPKDSGSLLVAAAVVLVITLTGMRTYSFWVDFRKIKQTVVVNEVPADNGRPAKPVVDVVKLDLFGKPQTAVEAPPEQEQLPETRLQLILRGVSSAVINSDSTHYTTTLNSQNDSGALIEGPDKSTGFFRIGSLLPGNAKLHAIYTDRIVIDRNGKLENLSFPEQSSSNSGSLQNFNSSGSPSDRRFKTAPRTSIDDPAPRAIGDSVNSQAFQSQDGLNEDDSSSQDSEVTPRQIQDRLEQLRDRIRQQRTQ